MTGHFPFVFRAELLGSRFDSSVWKKSFTVTLQRWCLTCVHTHTHTHTYTHCSMSGAMFLLSGLSEVLTSFQVFPFVFDIHIYI